jgi:hypothetical protein
VQPIPDTELRSLCVQHWPGVAAVAQMAMPEAQVEPAFEAPLEPPIEMVLTDDVEPPALETCSLQPVSTTRRAG